MKRNYRDGYIFCFSLSSDQYVMWQDNFDTIKQSESLYRTPISIYYDLAKDIQNWLDENKIDYFLDRNERELKFSSKSDLVAFKMQFA